MSASRSVLIWLRYQGVLFLLVLAAVAFYQFVCLNHSEGGTGSAIGAEWRSASEIKAELAELKRITIENVNANKSDLLNASQEAVLAALRQKRIKLKDVEAILATQGGLLANIRPSKIIERERLKLQQVRLAGEINVLASVARNRAAKRKLDGIFYLSQKVVESALNACEMANRSVRAYNRLNPAEKAARKLFYNTPQKLTQTAKTLCKRSVYLEDQQIERRKEGEAARKEFERSQAAVSQAVTDLDKRLSGYSPDVEGQTIYALFMRALLVFLIILATPFLIRVIFYYAIAPFAQSRASIRILAPSKVTAPIPLAENSRVSIAVTLGPAEELLVRQDYLQTSSLSAKKETRWLLDYGHVLSSIASGLTFLTQVRGDQETTTVSAVRDPFAELTEIVLATGAACVLHPRALVAVIQPIGQTLRISSHWRLLSLNAWLTLQFRYLVFHGPCRLIIKGGRGIRVEHAISGRIFGQDQLVGFSADLAYSVTRTETFWPYFFGRQQLFRDKVEQGSGVLIIEEAPLSSRQGTGVKRGLEGAFDASLKAFGI